jgi:hypothetical protein
LHEQSGAVAEDESDERVLWPQRDLGDGEGAPIEEAGFRIPSLLRPHHRQVVESDGELWVLGAERSRTDCGRLSVKRIRLSQRHPDLQHVRQGTHRAGDPGMLRAQCAQLNFESPPSHLLCLGVHAAGGEYRSEG